MISLLDSLKLYYGLDWISFVLGVLGLIYLTNKKPIGFLFTAVSIIVAASVAILAGQYGFLIANVVNCVLAVRGYYTWRVERVRETAPVAKSGFN